MDVLAESLHSYLCKQHGENAPSYPKMLLRLSGLLKTYPGGLTEACIATELNNMVSKTKRSSTSRKSAQGSHANMSLADLIKATRTAQLSWPKLRSPAQPTLTYTQQAMTQAVLQDKPAPDHALALVHLAECATGGASGAGQVWVCHLSDPIGAGVLLKLYLGSWHLELVGQACGGTPWLQGKHVRLSHLSLPPPDATSAPTRGPRSEAASSSHNPATAMPTRALLPVLTASQWQQRGMVLTALRPGQLRPVLDLLAPTMSQHPAGSNNHIIPDWLLATVQSVHHQDSPELQQVVAMLSAAPGHGSAASQPDAAAIPLVAQGPGMVESMALLQPGDMVAVHSATLQVQQSDGHRTPVLWCTAATRLVAAAAQVAGAYDCGPGHAETHVDPAEGVLWVTVESIKSCRRLGGHGAPWAVDAQLRVFPGHNAQHVAPTQQPDTRAARDTGDVTPGARMVQAQLICAADTKLVSRIQPGHSLLLVGVERTESGRAGQTQLVWREGGDCRQSLLLNLSTLPALLTTPALYTRLLRPGHQTPEVSQPMVGCVRLLSVVVSSQRVHRLCGRAVVQSLDLDDWDLDMEDSGTQGNSSKASGPSQRQEAHDEEHEDPAGQDAINTTPHPGLWSCGLCNREVAGNEVAWALTGDACIQWPVADPQTEQQLRHPAWSVQGVGSADQSKSIRAAPQGQDGWQQMATMHAVPLAADALTGLCGATAELWRSLSRSERVKRVPELARCAQPRVARTFLASLVAQDECKIADHGACHVCSQGVVHDAHGVRNSVSIVQLRPL